MQPILKLFSQAAVAWHQDNAQRLGAALTFYGIFALAPSLIVIFSLIGQFYHGAEVKEFVLAQINFWVSEQGRDFFHQLLAEVTRPEVNRLAFAVGSAVTIVAATSFVSEFRETFALIWQVKSVPKSRIIVLERIVICLLLLLGLALFLLFSLLLTTILSDWSNILVQWLAIPISWLKLLDILLSFSVMTVFLTILFHVLSPVSLRSSSALWGAFTTAVLFLIGKQLLTFYFQFSSIGSLYGAASVLMIILLWIYYAIQILLFGLEIVKVHHQKMH
ncbi:MAG: YihY/virulence factor BrkB family protein [Candidatus Abawacabacteria bacterium]|nr:YihY/virulence factor BrkB family protein [Candidatus Abawacabacteria bacterium]